MNWHTLASTLVGAFITFSAILFTHALDLNKRKRTPRKLIHARLQALRDLRGIRASTFSNSAVS